MSLLEKLGEYKKTSACSESSVFSTDKSKFLTLYNFVEEPCNEALNCAVSYPDGNYISESPLWPGLH